MSRILVALLCAGLVFTGMANEPEPPERMFRKAMYMETARGGYKDAVGVYDAILEAHGDNAEWAARALYRKGLCHEKLGETAKAAECARQLARDHGGTTLSDREIGLFVRKYLDATANTKAAGTALMEKLNSIIIPQIDCRQANLRDVFSFLEQQSAELDTGLPPDERGVKFIFDLNEGSYPEDVPHITLSLRNITLIDTIKYITEKTGLKYRVEDDAVIIATADAPQVMVTRTYRVPPSIAEIIISHDLPGDDSAFDSAFSERACVRKFFVEAGVPFPEGTSLVYRPSLNLLIASNTEENLERFKRVLATLEVTPIQVRIQADHIEITDADIASRFRLRPPPTMDELRALPATAYIVHSSLSVITKSGANAASKGVVEHTIDGERHDIGVTLNCTPVVGPDGYTIDITLIWSSTKLLERTSPPLIASSSIAEGMMIRHGGALVQPIHYQIEALPDEQITASPNPHFRILSVTLIDPDGKAIADRRW